MKKQFYTLALALTVLCSGLVYACEAQAPDLKEPQKFECPKPTPEQMEAFHQKRMEKLTQALDLTQEQVQKLEAIQQKSKEKIKPLIEKQRAKFEEIKQIRENDNILVKTQDEKIEKIEQELKVINQQIRQFKQDEKKAFKDLLTQEQKEKLNQMKEAHKEMKHKKHDQPHHLKPMMY